MSFKVATSQEDQQAGLLEQELRQSEAGSEPGWSSKPARPALESEVVLATDEIKFLGICVNLLALSVASSNLCFVEKVLVIN